MNVVADYQAKIQLIVEGQDKLRKLEKEIDNITKQLDSIRNKAGGIFNQKDLSKNTEELEAQLRVVKRIEEAQKAQINQGQQQLRSIEKEKRILFEQEKRQLAELDILRADNIQKEVVRYQGLGKAIKGSLSSAAIGGAFPLLFGQSPQAAVGGAIGGLFGGAGGGFAGSLVGTAIGELAAAKSAVNELGKELGFSEGQLVTLSKAFKQAGRDADNFDSAIRNIEGVGLSTAETASAVKLASELTEEYGGKIDKITQALANALEGGKVSISTLNSFTAQGIPIQEKLAEKYGVSRDKLLQLTKDGKVSVQDLVNELIEIGRAAEKTVSKSETAFEKFKTSVENLSTAIADIATVLLRTLAPALDTVLTKITAGINGLNTLLQAGAGRQLGLAGLSFTFGATSQGVDNIKGALEAISGISPQSVKEVNTLLSNLDDASRNLRRVGPLDPNAQLAEQLQGQIFEQRKRLLSIQRGLGGKAAEANIGAITAPVQLPASAKSGPKPPKDRTAQLLADLKATQEISKFEDMIRDAQFEYNELKVIDLQYKKRAADIERDTTKQLLNANYETEKAAILKIKDARLRDAELVKLDAIRKLERDITAEYYRRAGLDTRFLIQREGAGAFDTSLDLDPNSKAIEKLDEYKQELEKLVDPINNAAKGAEAIGTAFNSAFTELITGTKNAQEVLANFFRDVGKSFVDMAGKIISQLLIIYAYKSLLGIFGGRSTGLFTGEGPVSGASVFGAGQAGFNPAAFTPGLKFAEGGFVTGPTRALIGEGGESEYVIPASKMKSAMNRYATGARGNAVLSGGDETSGGGMATMAPAAIDVRYNVERINNVDYVTNQEFQAGLQQAATQGAERGQQLALRRLQQSVTTRRRLGI